MKNLSDTAAPRTTARKAHRSSWRRVLAWRGRNPALHRARQRLYDRRHRAKRALARLAASMADE